jgi:hypothetical protein
MGRLKRSSFMKFAFSISVASGSLLFVSSSVDAISAVPDPPQNVGADVIGTTTDVYWQAPTNDGGSPVTSYAISASAGNPGTYSGMSSGILCSTTSLYCAFQPSTNTTTLYVFAMNSSGYSGPTAVSVPQAPSGDGYSNMATPGDGQITVTWGAFYASPGVSLSYQVVLTSDDLTYNGRKCVTTTLQCVFTGLSSKDKYLFIIQATDGHGGFTPAEETDLVSPLTSPTTGPKSLATPLLSKPIRSSSGVTLHWRMPNNSQVPASYFIFYGSSSRINSMDRLASKGSGKLIMTHLISGLSRTKQYFFIVEARLNGMTSKPSNRTSSIG